MYLIIKQWRFFAFIDLTKKKTTLQKRLRPWSNEEKSNCAVINTRRLHHAQHKTDRESEALMRIVI